MTDNKNELKVGDLVETCQMLPGFITEFDEKGDGVSVFIPGKHTFWAGSHHSISHCGVHKIDEKYAMMLFSIGEDRLTKLYEEGTNSDLTWEEVVENEYNEMVSQNKHPKLLTLEEQLEECIKLSGYGNNQDSVLRALRKVTGKYENMK